MYKITAKFPSGNDLILYDPAGTGALPILGPKQTEELNQPGSLTFSLLYPHEAYGLLEGMKTYISSEKEGTEIFYGRVLDVEPDELTGQETVTCEGALSFLNDGFLAPDPKNSSGTTQSQTMTAEAFFRRCINEFNADIDNDPRRVFTVGNVTVTRKDETRLYQITQFTSAKEAIEQNLLNNYGGFLKVYRDILGRLMIDWVEDYGVVDSGRVELGENVISQSNRLSGENLFTAIRPVGKEGLVHSTTPIIDVYPAEEMAEYGRIVKNIDFPGITSESDLLAAGQALVQRINKTIYRSSEISLLDLHFVDEDEPEVNLGNRYTNIAGLEEDEVTVSTRNRDYENPQNDSISLKNAKHLEGNGIDDFKNNEGGISKQSSRSSGGVGMALKYYHELQDEATIIADRVRINGQRIDIAAETLIETGNEMERLSTVAGDLGNRVTGIEGTGVIQNSDRITQVSGKFRIETLPGESTTRVILEEGAKLSVEDDGVYSDVVGADGVRSIVTQTAEEIRSDVSAADSALYSSIEQTASAIRSTIADTENGLYNYIQNTASGTRQVIISTTNRTWIQDTDPRTSAGGSHQVKAGDIWIESTHQGTWDGAEGFNWEHDEGYDWTQIQGAKIWGWQNGKWELISDQQQVVSYSDVINTAEHYVSEKIAGLTNDEGLLDVYMSKIEQTATEIRSDISNSDSTIYSFIHQTRSNILLRVAEQPGHVYSKTEPTKIIYGEGDDKTERDPMNGDLWIDSQMTENWDAAFDLSWGDESGIDWNALRSDKIKVYKNGQWVDVVDGTKLVDDADIEVDRNTAKMYARKLEQVNGELQRYYAELKVDAHSIRSQVDEIYNGLGSRITQTAREIRSDVYAANSQAYSFISQTASQIRSEVGNSISGVHSSITQTANSIRSEVNNTVSGLRSYITQNANKIALVVDGNGNVNPAKIVAAINARTGSSIVKIQADQIELNGDTVASSLRGKSIGAYFLGCDDFQVTAQMSIDYDADWKLEMGRTTPVRNTIVGASVSDNVLTLTPLAGDPITFSKATTLTPSWSGSAFPLTMAAKQTNGGTPTTVASKTIGFGGLVTAHDIELQLANGGAPTKVANVSNIISCPVKVQQLTTGNPADRYSKDVQFSVASLLQEKTVTPTENVDVAPGSDFVGLSKVSVDVSAAYNAGYDAYHSMFIGDYDVVAIPSSYPLSLGQSIEVWPYFKKKDGKYQWGPKYTISAPSDPHPTRYTLRCTEATPAYPGSSVKNYTFTLQGVYSFSANTNYYFYR